MNTVIFTEDVTLIDFIIRVVTCGPVVGLMIGFVIYEILFDELPNEPRKNI